MPAIVPRPDEGRKGEWPGGTPRAHVTVGYSASETPPQKQRLSFKTGGIGKIADFA